MAATQPVIVDRLLATPNTAEIVFTVARNLRYLRGHFPGVPIVPGVVQIKWAIDEGAVCLGLGKRVIGLEAIKFRQVMQPAREVRLSLRFDEQTNKLHFSYESRTGMHSSGRLLLHS
ncbi:hypothetical protein [Candidatus Rariloculus sp.]|uniref:ApeI family dehydratase n=1 Tax=Candidatus Rariloculus sp. TaxID=3101265 RepID=UPI003D0A02CD